MKKIVYLFAIIFAASMIACGPSTKELQDKAKADSIVKSDSIAKIDSITKVAKETAKLDSVKAKAKEDSIAKVTPVKTKKVKPVVKK